MLLCKTPTVSAWRGALAAAMLLAAGLPAVADFEVKAPDGRRILVKDDGTWRALDAPAKPASGAASAAVVSPQAELRLTRRQDVPGGCAITLLLVNQLPYEIRALVPDFIVQRANSVNYSSHSVGFSGIKAGDQRQREFVIDGLACADVGRLLVQAGDRCEMGDLNRFSEPNGQCLARIRLQPSDLLKFEK